MLGRLVAVARLGIADAIDADHAVAADHPIAGAGRDRSRLALGQRPRQLARRPGLARLTRSSSNSRRARPRTRRPAWSSICPADLAVAGQYQRHSAPVDKSVEKSLHSPSAKQGTTQWPDRSGSRCDPDSRLCPQGRNCRPQAVNHGSELERLVKIPRFAPNRHLLAKSGGALKSRCQRPIYSINLFIYKYKGE